jgi:hypothetical protein
VLISMPTRRNFSTIDDFLRSLHKDGIGLLDFNGKKIPCIYVSRSQYDEIMDKVSGKKIAVDTTLNIFSSSDEPDVFVDMYLNFLNANFDQYFLLAANDNLEFFEELASQGIIAIAPSLTSYVDQSKLFMVQLPKKDALENALQIIKSKLPGPSRYTHCFFGLF